MEPEGDRLKTYLGGAVDFLKSMDFLLNSHMVTFISENIWENRIPEDIAKELNSMTWDDALNISYAVGSLKDEVSLNDFARCSTVKCHALIQYLVQCRRLSLEVLSSKDDVKKYFKTEKLELNSDKWCGANDGKLNLSPQYLTPAKKRHEVAVMSEFIANVFQKYLSEQGLTGAVVDIGGGKGYLGSNLAFLHGIKVLGIDVASNVASAAKTRNEKICRKLSEACSLYQQKTAYVSPKTDVGLLLKEVEEDWGKIDCVALVGLHTCGNLGPSCVELFASKSSSDVPIRMLCNVGCCYNLLEEKYLPDDCCLGRVKLCLPPSLNGNCADVPLESNPGFPMSQFLCQKMFWLGRNARNLASQSLDRVISERKIAVDSLFQRAVLQCVLLDLASNSPETVKQGILQKLEKMFLEGKGIGRLTNGNHVLSMYEYLSRAFGKLGIDFTLSEADVDSICSKFEPFKPKIKVFYVIRMFLAPVVETVILLDRLLYLLEKGISEAYLAKLFDPVVSPRCYGLCAQVN